jgi:hypothetical protein
MKASLGDPVALFNTVTQDDRGYPITLINNVG